MCDDSRKATPQPGAVSAIRTAESISVDVVKEFADTIACLDIWSYNEAGLYQHEEQLEEEAVRQAKEAGLTDKDISIVRQAVTMMFWRWIGRREGWTLKDENGPNPHEKFPWHVVTT